MKRRRPVTALPRHMPAGQLRRNLEAVQRFRLNVVFGALLILFVGLLGRLGKLQVVDAAAWSAEASQRHDRHHTFRGLKGRILDRHGRTLVTSRRVLSVSVDPSLVEEPRTFALRLAAMLDDADFASRIHRVIVTAPEGCRHRLIRPLVEDERVTAQLQSLMGYQATLRAGLRGLKVEEREIRTYPNGEYVAHILGRAPATSGDGEAPAGGYGAERAFHEDLKAGEVTVPVQREGGRRRQRRAALVVDPQRAAGRDLRLTLDIVIQHALETALDELQETWQPVFSTGLVLDPQTGELLALANRPTFDPAREAGNTNHAVQGMYSPGSLFKPFVAAYGLGLGVVQPHERIEMPVRKGFAWGRHVRVVSDGHPTADWDGYGDVPRILAYSCNPAMAEILWRVMEVAAADGTTRRSVEPVRAMMVRLGFDRPVGIELYGDKLARYDGSQGRWNPLYPTLGFAFGQSFDISPLRLACCFAAFARDDARILKPTLLPGGGGPRQDLPPVCAHPSHLALIRQGLAGAVDEGTAHAAFAGCRYAVSGKTGTAQVPGTSWQFASFAGFAPRDRPRVLVLVMAKVDDRLVHPETEVRPYGGNVGAPAVRRVIESSLDYLGPADEEAAAR